MIVPWARHVDWRRLICSDVSKHHTAKIALLRASWVDRFALRALHGEIFLTPAQSSLIAF